MTEPPERDWRWRLLYVGRLDPRKGTETLVRAMPMLPDETTLTLFGRDEGGHGEKLRSLVTELGVAERVSFGELERDQLASAYGGADVLVFPSEWEEPFGLPLTT